MDDHDKRWNLYLASPFIMGLVLAFIASSVKFGPALSPTEKDLLAFTPESVDVMERDPIFVNKALKSPIKIQVVSTKRNIRSPKRSLSPEKKVSFILIKRDKKLAIINGLVLKEGDTMSDSKIVRIKQDRVFIRESGGEGRWLKIE
jgi:hypothetical protein